MNREIASPFRPPYLPVIVCLSLLVATFVVYSPVAHYGFVDYDDSGYFFANPHVLGGLTWTNIKWAFTSGEYANWHPLTWLSLMLDRELFGKGASAPHLTNVILHAANSILLFLAFRRLTGTLWRSAILAMLFALHPLHVESVAWVAERKDVLSAFFGLLALLGYAGYATNNDGEETRPRGLPPLSYWLTLLFFACGLMSKPMLVTLPFVLLLLDFWPLQRFDVAPLSRLVIEKIPFFLMSGMACIVTIITQKEGGAVDSLTRIPLTMRVENTFISYARYLAKIFCPFNLATPYPYPADWPGFFVFFSFALFVALCIAVVVLRKKYPYAFTGWFWFAGMLVPVIGLVQVGGASMADRYSYLPLAGILLIVVWSGGEICARAQVSRSPIIFFLTLLFLAGAVRARNQVSVWKDDQTLFRHALAVTKNNYIASLDLGYWYSKNGNTRDALDYYYKALQMSPNDPTALYNVGNAFAKLGDWNEAIRDYSRALQITPDQPDILDNLGFALAQTRQLSDAAKCFEAVLKLKPASFGAHNNLATIYFIQGRYAEALTHYLTALQLSPDNPRVMVNLGDTYVRLNEKVVAMEYYQHALQLQPGNQTVRAKLQALGPQNPD